jgi:hypothetical protein
MIGPTVATFFYGSYINRDVLREVELVPERFEVAWLPGYGIPIQPLANPTPSDENASSRSFRSTTRCERGPAAIDERFARIGPWYHCRVGAPARGPVSRSAARARPFVRSGGTEVHDGTCSNEER